MKHKFLQLFAGILCAGIMAGMSAAGAAGTGATPVAAHADYWFGSIVMDGNYIPLSFFNEQGAPVYLFSYQGTVYLPLRTAGEWMEKKITWESASQTVNLSGTATEKGTSGEVGAQDHAREAALKAAGMDIQLRPDISVVVDGVEKHFVNANGEPVYPAAYAGSTYLPLRSVGELMAKEVNWSSDENGNDSIYLRTPLTAGENKELEDFINAALPITDQLEGLCNSALSQAYVDKDSKASEKTIRQIRTLLGKLDTLPKLNTDFGEMWYADYFLPMLAKAITEFDAGLARLDAGTDLVTVLDENGGAFSLTIQRLHQTLPSFVNKIAEAYQ